MKGDSRNADGLKPIGWRLIEFFFYGNFFYGLCVVGLILETAAQLRLNLGGPFFYVMAFLATVLFYNHPYARNFSGAGNNPRALWSMRHRRFIGLNQGILALALLTGLAWWIRHHLAEIQKLSAATVLLLLIFPGIGSLYYGVNFFSRRHNLRSIGWLKPFAIGFVWAGMANAYPILYSNLIHGQEWEIDFFRIMLFLKNLMYVAMLAILFDIKDYVVDSRAELNTLIVQFGLRKTLLFVVTPLTLLGLLTFISYALAHHFSLLKTSLILIPFLSLLGAIRLFRKRRSLLFYLVVIDGLLIVKAVFGIASMHVG